MTEEIKEPIGFLCRWLLLALAGLSVAGAAWAGVSSTFGLRERLSMRMICPDHVSRGGKRATGLTLVTGPARHANRSLLLLVLPDGRLMTPIFWRGLWVQPYYGPDASPGVRSAVIQGMPYGPLTLQRRQVAVHVLTREQPVVVVDARLALAGDAPRTVDALRRLGRLGAVVLYYPGQPHGFPRVHEQSRGRFAGTPILCRQQDATVDDLAARFPASVFRSNYVVVTGDAELADGLARRGPTYLVAPGEPLSVGRLKRLASLEQVVRALEDAHPTAD